MINASVVVAHPDDCLLFAYHFIMAHPFNWRIIYLTHAPESARGREVSEFWKKRNCHCEFLGFPDDPADRVKKIAGFDKAAVKEKLEGLVTNDHLILTHHSGGEYGHPHHKFLSAVSNEIDIPKIYFGHFTNESNLSYSVDRDPFELDEIPVHAAAVKHFSSEHNLLKKASYVVSPAAKSILAAACLPPSDFDRLIQEVREHVRNGDRETACKLIDSAKTRIDDKHQLVRLRIESAHCERQLGDAAVASRIFSELYDEGALLNLYDLGISNRRASKYLASQHFLRRDELTRGLIPQGRIERALAFKLTCQFELAKECIMEALSYDVAPNSLIKFIKDNPCLTLNGDDLEILATVCFQENSELLWNMFAEIAKKYPDIKNVRPKIALASLPTDPATLTKIQKPTFQTYESHASNWNGKPGDYLSKLNMALRSGVCSIVDDFILQGKVQDPRTSINMFTYWDTDPYPNEIHHNIQSWKKYSHSSITCYSDTAAVDYLRRNFEASYVECYKRCIHPAMKSDFFRLCKLYKEGGFYIDADELLTANPGIIFALADELKFERVFVVDVMSPHFYVQNHAMFINKKNDVVIQRALLQAHELILNSDPQKLVGKKIWSATGPGCVSKAIIDSILSTPIQIAPKTAFISSIAFRNVFVSPPMAYKSEVGKNWRQS